MPCPDVFVQDVDAYLNRKGVELACYFDPESPAVIDDAHQARVNYEAFFFSKESMVAEFRAEPLLYCGTVTDPVTKRRFRPNESSPTAAHGGVLYFFQHASSRERFLARPGAYELPGWRM